MGSYEKAMESYKKTLTAAASVAASAMLVRGMVNEFVPHEMRKFIFSRLSNLLYSKVSSDHTLVIDENEGYSTNQIFKAVQIYLATRINTDMQRLKVSRVNESKSMMISMEAGEEMIDKFDGVEFRWELVYHEKSLNANSNSNRQLETASFELNFNKKYKDKALNEYLPFILQMAKEKAEQERTLKIHMNEWESWEPIDLHHPSTFDTLAIDSELKQTLMDDLARFLKRKDYYKRIGKAWKRGYLLYGPPGTGKSSLVAAMANYLKFDIYDLELTAVGSNSRLKKLLISMSNRSILLIEDIDCTINNSLHRRDADGDELSGDSNDDEITLSGLLNFVDGLWSTSGEERIIVFTTNYKERLDPALTRPGRMDMHVHMGYCGFCGFQVLAKNYHMINDHKLFPEIDGLLKEVEVTPAEVAEELMKSEDSDVALKGFVEFLKGRKEVKFDGEKAGEEKEMLVFEGTKQEKMLTSEIEDYVVTNQAIGHKDSTQLDTTIEP